MPAGSFFSFYDCLFNIKGFVATGRISEPKEIGGHLFNVINLSGDRLIGNFSNIKTLRQYIQQNVCLTEGEFRQIDEALFAAVGSVVGQGLAHQVGFQPGGLQAFLHELHCLQADRGVEMAVHADDGSPCK